MERPRYIGTTRAEIQAAIREHEIRAAMTTTTMRARVAEGSLEETEQIRDWLMCVRLLACLDAEDLDRSASPDIAIVRRAAAKARREMRKARAGRAPRITIEVETLSTEKPKRRR